MDFIYKSEKSGNDVVECLREIAEAGFCEIVKDDFISFKAKAGKRLRFSVQFEGIIIEAKQISLVNDHKNIKYVYDEELDCKLHKADEIRFNYMFLDKTSINLDKFDFGREKMSLEVVGC